MAERVEPYPDFDPSIKDALSWLAGKQPVMNAAEYRAATERLVRMQEVIALTRTAAALERLADAREAEVRARGWAPRPPAEEVGQ